MTPVLYFLYLKTLDIILFIVNISVADDTFYKKYIYIVVIWRLNLTWKNVNFQQFFVVVKMTERRKKQNEVCSYFTQLFIYFITVNKYQFCISVIGNINMQIIGIGIGYKKSISVDHYLKCTYCVCVCVCAHARTCETAHALQNTYCCCYTVYICLY